MTAESGGIGSKTTLPGLTSLSGKYHNEDAIALSPSTADVTLKFALGSIANFAVASESQFRTIIFHVDSAQKAVVFGDTPSGLIVNLDLSSTIQANSTAASTINAALREALLQAFGTDNLTNAIQKAYSIKIGVVPPYIDDIEGDLGKQSCSISLRRGSQIDRKSVV